MTNLMTTDRPNITISTTVHAPMSKVWEYWTSPEHITKWNNASDDWHSPRAENNLVTGGTFTVRMEAKDGSAGFDFGGTYTDVIPRERIAYTMGDGRKVEVLFRDEGEQVAITETFEAESENSLEMQQSGWQSILDNFKKYTEQN